ncbi:hypothetical protein BC628DRAFT_1027975 [Trametes gibbosa]|nr:hypothetical protein BC628DRAFT_1027975 [Trametes gibbosa]
MRPLTIEIRERPCCPQPLPAILLSPSSWAEEGIMGRVWHLDHALQSRRSHPPGTRDRRRSRGYGEKSRGDSRDVSRVCTPQVQTIVSPLNGGRVVAMALFVPYARDQDLASPCSRSKPAELSLRTTTPPSPPPPRPLRDLLPFIAGSAPIYCNTQPSIISYTLHSYHGSLAHASGRGSPPSYPP